MSRSLLSADVFEDFEGQIDTAAWAQSGGWIIETPDLVRLGSEYAQESGSGLGVVASEGNAPRGAIYKTKLGLLGPVVEIVWNVRIDQDCLIDLFARGLTEATNQTETVVQIRLDSGAVSCGINGGGGFVNVATISTGEWTKITAKIDLEAQVYQVTVGDGPPSAEMHFATNSTENIREVDWVGIGKNNEGPGQVSFDNITVTCPVPLGQAPVGRKLDHSVRLPLEQGAWQLLGAQGGAQAAGKSVDGLGTISSVDGTANVSQEASVSVLNREVQYVLPGRPPGKHLAKWEWTTKKDVVNGVANYVSFQFRGEGFFREIGEAYPVIKLSGIGLDGRRIEEVLQDANTVVNDGNAHLVVAKLKTPMVPESVQVQLVTTDSLAQLSIWDFILYGDMPVIDALGTISSSVPRLGKSVNLVPINLDKVFNDSLHGMATRVLEKERSFVDGGTSLSTSQATLAGIPFQFGADNNLNVAASVNTPSGNEKMVPFIRGEVSRLFFGPNGRDDLLEIPIDHSASELFLCLSAENRAFTKRAVSGGIPFQFDDVEAFTVEVRYEDGETDLAFPFSLSDEAAVIRRMVGVYVVPTDPTRQIKSIALRNRQFDNTVGLLALTLNPKENRLVPALAEEAPVVRPPKLTPVRKIDPSVRKEGDRVIAENSYYRFVINTAKGLSIESCKSGFSSDGAFALSPDSGIEISLDGQTYRGGDLSFETAEIEGASALIHFSLRKGDVPLRVRLRLSADSGPELAMNLALENGGNVTLKPAVRFPVIRNLVVGSLADTWYLFPQYRNVISNRSGFFRARNDREFPMQFWDVYNPRLGLGLGVLTRNRGYLPMTYALEKNDKGLTSSVEYGGEYHPIEGGQTRDYPETALLFHSSDWHECFDAYQTWLSSWHPSKSPTGREWVEKIFWMHSLNNSAVLADMYDMVPTFVDQETKKFNIEGVLWAEKEVFGILPDAVDFFAWFYSDKRKSFEYNTKMERSYENAGGLPVIKEALADLKEANIQSGFYMIPDRISTSSEYAQEHDKKDALKTSAGHLMVNSEEIFMCPGSSRWLKYFSDLCRQLQSDTDVNFVYLDVFAFTAEMSCFDTSHGHPVPFAPNLGTDQLLRNLRDALPEKTGVFAEYAANDVTNERLDGNLTYYFLPLERYITAYSNVDEESGSLLKATTHLYRFAFPSVKQLSFAFGIESDTWGHLKATFFNGDAVFDATWRLYYPGTREFLRKSLTIKREYLDCFTTRDGVPMVQTERAGVFANMFPGTNRSLWTLYNERPTTVRGCVIAVDHREGATYFDVWNNRPLTPEIKDGKALLSTKLDPQGVGCVVQILPQAAEVVSRLVVPDI